MNIKLNGQNYEITNWDEFRNQVLFMLGEELVNRIQDKAMDMRLFDDGRFIRGIKATVEGDSLVISDDVDYGKYLEFGTFTFGGSYDEQSYPETMFPKKKDLPRSIAKRFPKGMQPFAPFRRVIYNQSEIDQAVKAVFS